LIALQADQVRDGYSTNGADALTRRLEVPQAFYLFGVLHPFFLGSRFLSLWHTPFPPFNPIRFRIFQLRKNEKNILSAGCAIDEDTKASKTTTITPSNYVLMTQ
jgi:hypothetical protein